MKDILKAICSVILFIAILFAFMWAIEGNDFFMYKLFAPKQEQVRREVYEQSVSYNQGMVQDLENMQTQYLDPNITQEQKSALKHIILDRASKFDLDKEAPPDLRNFIDKLTRGNI